MCIRDSDKGERKADKLKKLAYGHLSRVDSVQYLELVDVQNLEPIQGVVDKAAALCVAAYVGNTRLIDNVMLTPSAGDITQKS